MRGVKLTASLIVVILSMANTSPHRARAGTTPSTPDPKSYTSPSTNAFSLDATTNKIVVNYVLGVYKDAHFEVGQGKADSTDKLLINMTAVWGYTPPTADVNIAFKFGKSRRALDCKVLQCTIPVTWDALKKQYSCKNTDLEAFAGALVDAVNGLQKGFDASNPIPAATGATITITPHFVDVDPKTLTAFAVDNSLEVDFQQVLAQSAKSSAQPVVATPQTAPPTGDKPDTQTAPASSK